MKQEKPVRVQKVIADRGYASRREAEAWIEESRVTVNGATISLGDKCRPFQDDIRVDGKRIRRTQQTKMVFAMNKPRGYLCTNKDPHGGKTVFDLLPPELRSVRLSCVGRLDKESEGLLLLTNDGELQNKLAHPSYRVRKIYHAQLNIPLKESDVPKLIRGITWEGQQLSVEKVFPIGDRVKEDWKNLELTMHHGKKREIRRLFYAFGYDVKRLRRVQIGNLRLRAIPRGQFKALEKKDIDLLFESSYSS